MRNLFVCGVFAACASVVLSTCPDDGCGVSDAGNTAPSLSAALSSGVLQVSATSYGGKWMFIGSSADDSPDEQGQLTCAPTSAVGAGATTGTCSRTMDYAWDWATVVAPTCSGQALATITPGDDYVEHSVRVFVVDEEISGTVFGTPACTQMFHSFDVRFRFPTNATYSSTISVVSSFTFANAFVNRLTHNLDTCVTRAELLLGLSYPYKLDGVPQLASGPVSSAVVTQLSASAECTSNSENPCTYTFEVLVTECFCGFDGNAIEPSGDYEFNFVITARDGATVPQNFVANHTLDYTIPSDLVDCNPIVYVGQATLSPSTVFTDVSNGNAQTATTLFNYQQPVTLRIPVTVDFDTPVSGRLQSLRVCEFATMNLAQTTPCSSTFEELSFDGSTYVATSGFKLQDDTTYSNLYTLESTTDNILSVTFYIDSFQSLSSSSQAYLRLEILVDNLRFQGDSKKAIHETPANSIYPTAFAKTAVAVARATGQREQNQEQSSPSTADAVTKSTSFTASVVVVAAAIVAFAIHLFVQHNRKATSSRMAARQSQSCTHSKVDLGEMQLLA